MDCQRKEIVERKHKSKAPKCMTFRGFTFINYLTIVVFLPSFIFLSVPCLSL